MKYKRWLVVATLIAVAATAYTLHEKQKGKVNNPFLPQTTKMEPQIELQFKGVVLQGRQKGVKRWNIWSSDVEISQDQQFVYFKNRPRGSFFNLKDWTATDSPTPMPPPPMMPPALPASVSATGGLPIPVAPPVPTPSPTPNYYKGKLRTANWVADRATYDTYGEFLRLEDHAKLVTDDKDELKSDQIEYRSRQNMVAITKPLHFSNKKKLKITSDGATVDIKFEVLDLKGRVAVDSPLKAKETVKINSDKLRYDRKMQFFQAQGKVVIRQVDTTIRSEMANYNQRDQVSYTTSPVEVVQTPKGEPKTVLNGDRLTMYHREQRVFVDGNVKLNRSGVPGAKPASKAQRDKLKAALKQEPTNISGDRMEYWTNRKDAKIYGHVQVRQKEKQAFGEYAFLDNTTHTITLANQVHLIQTSGNWLVRAKLANPRDNDLKGRVTLDCDELTIDQRTNNTQARGNVKVVKKDQVATSNLANYDDLAQTTTLTDNVWIRKQNSIEWLKASKVVVYHKTDRFEAFGLSDRQAEATFISDDKSTHVYADSLKQDTKKQAVAHGKVRIVDGDMTLRSEDAIHDQKKKISRIPTPVEVVQSPKDEPRTTISGDRLTMFHGEKRVVVEGKVKMTRAGTPNLVPMDNSKREKLKTALRKEDTMMNGDRMEYWTAKKDAKFDGHVLAYQKEKKAQGERAFIDHAKQTITFNGKVRLTQINGNWLIREGLVDTAQPDPQRDEALANPVVIDCDQLVIDQKTNNATATGKLVAIRQKSKIATGKKAAYDDKAQTTTLTEDVKIRRPDTGEWLKANKVVFHHDTEKFEAYGTHKQQVETEFGMDK